MIDSSNRVRGSVWRRAIPPGIMAGTPSQAAGCRQIHYTNGEMAMRHFILCSAQAILLWTAWLTPQVVTAQVPGGTRPLPPPVSPYLNLLRGGSSAANNYFNLVLPQIEYGNSINSLQQQVNTVATQVTTGTQGTTGPL